MPRPAVAEQQLYTALERLLEQGERFTAIGMQRIADEAGVARSTIYKHFADKSELLVSVTEDATAELFAVAEAWVTGGHYTRETLEAVIAQVIAQHRLHKGLFNAIDEVSGYDEDVAAFWRGRMDRFCTILEAAMPAGVDAPVLARFIAWGVERHVFAHTAVDDGAGDPRLAAGMADAIWLLIQPR